MNTHHHSEPTAAPDAVPAPLCWSQSDVEQRLGFRGQRFTRVNSLLSGILGLLLTVCFFGLLALLGTSSFKSMFTERGLTPYFIVFFFCWSLVILGIKYLKLRLQEQALSHDVVPANPEFVLSPETAVDVLDQIYRTADDPRQFILFNRLIVALGNLKNLGRVSDVDDILRSQADHEAMTMETSYSLLRGFVWAIPVLGFIGTVIGLSQAVGGFGRVLGTTSDVTRISASLRTVTSGLATAFETTLLALVAALILQLIITFLKKSEEEFLEACTDYCLRRIVSRLRTLAYEKEPV